MAQDPDASVVGGDPAPTPPRPPKLLERMRQQPLPFLDALILGLVERAAGVDVFVTWNARHFRGKTALPVLTPEEFLAR